MHRPTLIIGLAVTTVLGAAVPGTALAANEPTAASPAALVIAGTPHQHAVAPGAVLDRDAATVLAMRDVPAFGGAYVEPDTGELHLWLTGPSADTAVRARAALAKSVGVAASADTVVHRANYSFAQLKAWHDRMSDLLAEPAVTMTDIDERTNRLTVGVDDVAKAAGLVTAWLSRQGIPRAAVNLVAATPVSPTLRDRTRPLHSGTQIQFARGAATFNCTLGFPAVRNGRSGFVTNSHCSTTRSVVDSGNYWQPTRPAGDGNVIGVETVDPPMFTHVPCPIGRSCRRTDANFVEAVNGAAITVGRIPRPPLGSLTWNGTDTYRVTATGFAFVGDAVQKVGRSTGRTFGNVTATCMNFNVTDSTFTLLCQDVASYASADGDSGSPVFRVSNSPAAGDVTAVGIHNGRSVVGGQSVATFSSFPQLIPEIGTIRVCAIGVC